MRTPACLRPPPGVTCVAVKRPISRFHYVLKNRARDDPRIPALREGSALPTWAKVKGTSPGTNGSHKKRTLSVAALAHIRAAQRR
jgi:hypothetical protein